MDWFKKHVDACIVMSSVIGCFLWMNSSIYHLETQMNSRFSELEKDVAIVKTELFIVKSSVDKLDVEMKDLQKETAIIKTVMILQKIMPCELATKDKIDE